MDKKEIQDIEKREFIKKGLFAIGVGGAAAILSNVSLVGAERRLSTLTTSGDVAINSNKFTIAANTGNTSIAGTLSVTGNITENNLRVATVGKAVVISMVFGD